MAKSALKVSVWSLAVNIILSVYKLAVGILAGSRAMVSDAVHSAGDVFSTFVVIAGVKAAGRREDEDHQYGHEKMESVAGIILAVLLCLTGLGIGRDGVKRIIGLINGTADFVLPGRAALLAAVVSVAVKEAMYRVTARVAKREKSSALMADAWHHRSDALSSVGSFFGILFARMGFPAADSIACVIICLFILKAAREVFGEAMDKLTDKACDSETVERMRRVISARPGVLGTDLIRTRLFGNRIYVDVEIQADGNMSLWRRHDVAEAVHDSIEENFPDVKHCMVHVNPRTAPVQKQR